MRTITLNDRLEPAGSASFSFPATPEINIVYEGSEDHGLRLDDDRTRTVLVVDDDLQIRNMLEMSLRLEGFEVLTASDGGGAMEVLKSKCPDVMLLDIMMPVLDGFGVIDRMCPDGEGSAVPIIVLSAKAGDEDLWAGWSRGVDSYITKPLDIEVLLREIDRVTGARCAA